MRSNSKSFLLAAGLLLAGSIPALAFSQIGREDGTLPDRDGVVSTPLPPLAMPPSGADAPSQGETAAESPAGSGTTPPSDGAPSQPAAPNATTVPPAPPPAQPAAPSAPEQPNAAPGASSPAQEAPAGAAPTAPGAVDNEEGTDPAASQAAVPEEPTGPPPNVVYGDAELPTPVRDLRARLIEIAKTGEIDKLRPYIESGEDGTVLSFGGIEGDPIDFLKTASGDGEGVELLAILLEVLQSGHIRSEAGTDNEIYVWPYFAGLAVDKLTKPQKVELFELVTAGDYQEMVAFGAYNFYRVGISPDGKLQFFVAGD